MLVLDRHMYVWHDDNGTKCRVKSTKIYSICIVNINIPTHVRLA